MRWLKFGIVGIVFILALYAISMSFVAENKSFTMQKEINFPVEKVFPQFNNLQNFSRWNSFFVDNPNLSFDFFTPYEGQGSSMSYHTKKDNDLFGDFFIRYQNPNKTLRYQLFDGKTNNPYLIDVKFIPKGQATTIIWHFNTPKQPLLKRSLNLFSEDYFADNLDRSMKTLANILSNKVDKEQQRENMKFDSIMVENKESQLLLGVNVNSKNVKNLLFENIVLNHNKVSNFVKIDLGKKEDEFGEPVLITDADNFKDKEISYFYGIPLSKKVPVSDNNFSFRTINASKNLVMYYRGSFSGRISAIQDLISKAKGDTLKVGDLQQTFLEEPVDEKNAVIKFSLPVFR